MATLLTISNTEAIEHLSTPNDIEEDHIDGLVILASSKPIPSSTRLRLAQEALDRIRTHPRFSFANITIMKARKRPRNGLGPTVARRLRRRSN